jgi:hypothetical protein
VGVDTDMRLIHFLYNIKSHINIARGEVGWLTGWLPEIVSVGILLQFFGWNFTKTQVILFFPLMLLFLALFGYIWRKSGIYKIETNVDAENNPVQKEILEAARKINKDYKEKEYDEFKEDFP